MRDPGRSTQILSQLHETGFVSVAELAVRHGVSEVTIRRDLRVLEEAGLALRTHGGALLPAGQARLAPVPDAASSAPTSLVDRVDVLVAASVASRLDLGLLERAERRGVPVIAESVPMPGARTLVAVDNLAAGTALGRWAGAYAQEHYGGAAAVLDLTLDVPNTTERSRGFLAGLRETQAALGTVQSVNAGADDQTAYQITRAVLEVHPEINLIFAINDVTASGAIRACADHGRTVDSITVMPFGLEGARMRAELRRGEFCRVGLAMFPEIVAPICVEAGVLAYNDQELPPRLTTPYAVLTTDTVAHFYPGPTHIELSSDAAKELANPLEGASTRLTPAMRRPTRAGFLVPYGEHDWYRALGDHMRRHASRLGIDLEVLDSERSRRDDLAMRERELAATAATLIEAGDVVLLDCGRATEYLAELIADQADMTVITNSIPVFEALRDRRGIRLVLTGGEAQGSAQALTGAIARNALRGLRADKLFLTVAGISAEFGLSHTNLAEASMKAAMVEAAKEVIVLADHTIVGQDSVAHVAGLDVVHRVVADAALPAEQHLALSQAGIDVIIAPAG